MIVVLGANHRSAPLELRERLAFAPDRLEPALRGLAALEGIDEALVLSTCNRTEVLACTPVARRGLEAIRGFLTAERTVTRDELERFAYHQVGHDAVRHMFEVTSGLDSMILGEPQITGQVKQAYRQAREAGTTGAVLEKLLQASLATAKRVRAETGISRHPVSVAFAAVELARKIFGRLEGRAALLLGAGKMAALVATHLAGQGVRSVSVSSRTYNRAARLAERVGGTAVNWDDALAMLPRVDIVVGSTGAPEPILHRAEIQRAMRARRGAPLFLIDIAVPRDIDPAANTLDNVYLYDVDDLQGVVDDNFEGRREAAAEAATLITEEVERFERWRQSLSVAPTIVSLRRALLAVGEHEVTRLRRRLGPLTPRQEQAVQELARGIVQKILHRPIRFLKRSAGDGEAARAASWFGEVFGIDPGGEPGPAAASREAARPSTPPPDPRSEAAAPRPEAEGVVASDGPSRVIKGGKER